MDSQINQNQCNKEDDIRIPEDKIIKYMKLALNEAQQALEDKEVAVGCVMVIFETDEKGKQSERIIAKAHNLTNRFRNATQHCEIICINEILQNNNNDNSVFKNVTLFVTCEPCIMCAHALAIIGIKEAYFGCYNDRFGGNGTILELNTGKNGSNSYKSYGGYLKDQCKQLFKDFYEKGNENLEEEKRHRKKTKK